MSPDKNGAWKSAERRHFKMQRHGMTKPQQERSEVPFGMMVQLEMRDGGNVPVRFMGKMLYQMDEGFFYVIDTAGAGVVASVERGDIKSINIWSLLDSECGIEER